MRAPILIVPALASIVGLAQPNVTAWNVLVDGFNDKKLERRQQAITAIGSIGPTPQTIELLEKALRDEDPAIRQTTAAVVGQMKFRQSIPLLKAALDDESGEVAFTAAKALWDMGDRSGKDIIEEVLTGERKDTAGLVDSAKRDARAKLHNPRSLTLMGVKEASGALLGPFSIGIYAAEQAFKDSGASGRTLSTTLLAQDCDAQALQVLESSLGDRNWAVKAASARAIGQCGNPDAIPKLEQYLSDSHDAVKFMAAGAIVRLSLPPAPHQ